MICGPQEAKTIQYTLLGLPRSGFQKRLLLTWVFFLAAHQPGFPPQAVNIYHPTELLCSIFGWGCRLPINAPKWEHAANNFNEFLAAEMGNACLLDERRSLSMQKAVGLLKTVPKNKLLLESSGLSSPSGSSSQMGSLDTC